MALSDINVRIGAEITQFQAGLRRAERELQRSADKFNQLGNNLSLALSLPLAAAGVSALKSAGDIEALRLGFEATMTGAGKSTAEATAELLKLQKAAEAPGLDFEQAVKGSVRLQNVGFEAEQSRKILSELANAISLTGGNAQQLDGVTKQFAQMAGKGRILQEDLSILVENMPVLSKVMKETFGTANAEGLRQLGISTEEFILKTTEGLAKLERVPGGINNAFVNAGASIKLALGNVGESINKAFDVTGKLEAFSTLITDLAAGFSALDPALQKLIVGFGLAAAAAGPLFKLIGGSIEVYSAASSAVKKFAFAGELARQHFETMAPAVGNLKGALGAAGVAWSNLNTVAKATVIGAALAVVIALGVAFSNLSDSMSTAGRVQKTLNEVSLEAQKNIAAERLEAERNIGVINSNVTSYEEKLAAQKRLEAISPIFQKNLSLEADGHARNTALLKEYTDQLLTAARAQAAQGKIVELEKQRLDIAAQLAKQQKDLQGKGIFAAAFLNTAGGAGSVTGLLEGQIKDIEAQQRALADISLKANQANAKLQQQAVATAGAPVTGNVLPTGAPLGGDKPIAIKRITAPDLLPTKGDILASAQAVADQLGASLNKVMPQVAASLEVPVNPLTALADSFAIVDSKAQVFGKGFDAVAEKIKLTESAITSLLENGVNPYGTAIPVLVEQLNALKSQQSDVTENLANFNSAITSTLESGIAETLGSVAVQVGNVIAGVGNGSNILAAGLSAIATMMGELGKIAIGAGVATLGIKKAFQTLNGFVAIGAGVALVAIAAAVHAKVAKLKVPAFAEGGLLYGPQTILAGEYPGARQNPEVIAPLSKLKDMLGNAGGGVRIYGRLSGSDILLSGEREDTRRARRRGY